MLRSQRWNNQAGPADNWGQTRPWSPIRFCLNNRFTQERIGWRRTAGKTSSKWKGDYLISAQRQTFHVPSAYKAENISKKWSFFFALSKGASQWKMLGSRRKKSSLHAKNTYVEGDWGLRSRSIVKHKSVYAQERGTEASFGFLFLLSALVFHFPLLFQP